MDTLEEVPIVLHPFTPLTSLGELKVSEEYESDVKCAGLWV